MKNERTSEGLTLRSDRYDNLLKHYNQRACHEMIGLGTGSVGVGSTNLLEIVIF